MSPRERENRFLEGTGSMVFDRKTGGLMLPLPRTDEGLFRDICETLDYQAVCFDALDKGTPVYHSMY